MVKSVLFCAFLLVTCWHLLSSDQPMSKSLFCTQPPSRINFLATFRCFFSPLVLFFFRKRARAGSSHIPFFNSSYSCFAAHFFQRADLACFKSIFITSCGQTYLMSTLTCPAKVQVSHCGHLMPKSRISHITAPAVLSLVSTPEPRKPGSSQLLFVLLAIFQSTSLLPKSESSHCRELFFHFKAKCFQDQ